MSTIQDDHINVNDVLLLPYEGNQQLLGSLSNLNASEQQVPERLNTPSQPAAAGATQDSMQMNINNWGSPSDDDDQWWRFHRTPSPLDRPDSSQSNKHLTLDMLEKLDEHEDDNRLMDELKQAPLYRNHQENSFNNIQPLHNNNDAVKPAVEVPKLRLASEQHIGNNRFYIQLSIYRQQFLEAKRDFNFLVCNDIIKKIFNAVTLNSPPGRFLEYNPMNESGSWKEIGVGKECFLRIQAALLDPPNVSLSKFSYHNIDTAPSTFFQTKLSKIASTPTAQTDQLTHSVRDNASSVSFKDSVSYRQYNMLGSEYADSSIHESMSYVSSQVDSEFTTDTIFSTMDAPMKMSSGARKKKKGMRRRGKITSTNITPANMDNKKQYEIGHELEELVQSVFEQSMDIETISEQGTESSYQFYKKTKPRNLSTASVCSSTSSTGGLRRGFEAALNFGTSSRAGSTIEVKEKPIQRESLQSAKVKYTDEATGSARMRPLSKFDILCEDNMSSNYPSIKICNHIGNNRMRMLLKIHHMQYNFKDTPTSLKSQMVYDIMRFTLDGEKCKSKFIIRKRNEKTWTEIAKSEVPKIIVTSLEQCVFNPELYSLPPLEEASFFQVSGDTEESSGKVRPLQDLYKVALGNIRKRRNKRSITSRDQDAIAQLQNSVIQSGK